MDKPLFKQIEFIKSITRLDQKPQKRLPEIAFIGRSNVGKSSLLNAICNKKNIAKVSSTPGKTRVINYFLIDNQFYFVDLPGYGYAKLPAKVSNSWKQMIEEYLLKSGSINLSLLLIDSRHRLLEADMQMIKWLKYNALPFALVLTKADKISNKKLQHQVQYYNELFPDHTILPFSTKRNDLKHNLSEYILNCIL